MEEEVASIVSNDGANLMVEASDSNSSSCQIHVSKRLRRDSNSSVTKFTGVVAQLNGHWGAQIYSNHKRIWLGTFKTERDAAMAYDSAGIKLRSGDCHRNFPWTNLSIKEPDFQSLYSTEAILNMIKDGSYPTKFVDFLKNRPRSEETEVGLNLVKLQENGEFLCQQLFQKELTPSDVGQLNRLVIPKKYAVKYFPPISETAEENMENGTVDNFELAFYDRSMKSWKFRYCYWSSSQSFVFTRGWSRFVREKELKANDIVTFYTCDCKEGAKKGQTFYMIDAGFDREGRNDCSVGDVNQYVGVQVEFPLGLGQNVDSDQAKELHDKQLVGAETTQNTVTSGFRLFGVQIDS